LQLQFEKSQIQCLQKVVREVQNQELTQEIRLTDGMPDVGRVIASWGQPIIRSKEWRSSGMQVSGGVMAWTLYIPEDGTAAQCVESWLPFQMKWEFSSMERDGTICVMPLLQYVDARCLSSRKIMVRAGVSVLGEASVLQESQICTPGELPQDIQILKKPYPMQIPKEAGEKAFTLDTDISLPASAPALEKVISYELRFDLRETKIVGDKLVFRGVATVHLRYLSTDGKICSWELEIPFSQYADLNAEQEDNAGVRMCFVVTGAELEQGTEENLTLKANVIGQYVIYDRYMAQIIADAYSPLRPTEVQMEALTLPAVLDMDTQSADVEKTLETECVSCADVTFYPEHPKVYHDNGKLYAQLSGVLQILGYDGEGELCTESSRWDADWQMDLPAETGAEVMLNPAGANVILGADTAVVQSKMLLDITALRESEIPMLCSLQIGEITEADPNRPSLVLRRTGNKTLWEHAKDLGSTVEMIMSANGLQQEPEKDKMLLIPIL